MPDRGTLQRFLVVLDKLGLRDEAQIISDMSHIQRKRNMRMPSWRFPELDVLSPELYDYLQRVKKSRKKGRVNRVD
jgi:RNA processing factor Prp31